MSETYSMSRVESGSWLDFTFSSLEWVKVRLTEIAEWPEMILHRLCWRIVLRVINNHERFMGTTLADATRKKNWGATHGSTLQEDYNVQTSPKPEVPDHLKRIIGLTVEDKTYPALVLSKPLVDYLAWACQQNRKTQRILKHLRSKTEALGRQDKKFEAEHEDRQKTLKSLAEELDAAEGQFDLDAMNRIHGQMNVLKARMAAMSKQRAKWDELKDDLITTGMEEGFFHGTRLMKAMTPLEEYLENSGLLRLDVKSYLEEMRAAGAELREYYDEVRRRLLKHQWGQLTRRTQDLDEENLTGMGSRSDLVRLPSEFEDLIAEYSCRKEELRLAQAEFDDRNACNRENLCRWEELGDKGEERPTRSEFDRHLLSEDIHKLRKLRRAEAAMADVRTRMREHADISDVDSHIPEHRTPIKRTDHTGLIRKARANDRIQPWIDNLSSGFGSIPERSTVDGSWSGSSVLVEEAYSIAEKDSFILMRKKGWEEIQSQRQRPRGAGPISRPNNGDHLSRRRRRSSTTFSEISGVSNKRFRPFD